MVLQGDARGIGIDRVDRQKEKELFIYRLNFFLIAQGLTTGYRE